MSQNQGSIFKLVSEFKPDGDQPKAISQLLEGLNKGMKKQTLLGATGTGKTFTMANVIKEHNKPTLVIAHNKTLAAQLAQEFKEFFPDAAVHYFVSYYDYYQPEAYMPVSDTYIEKDASINKEIDRLRHASTQALLTRKDVVIVASVSCIYGLGSPEEYEKVNLKLETGMKLERNTLMKKLIDIHFSRTNADLTPGTFRSIGPKVEFMPVSENVMYSVEFGNSRSDLKGSRGPTSEISKINKIDPVSMQVLATENNVYIFPAKHFITEDVKVKKALENIKKELALQLKQFEKEGKLLEAERIKRRTNYDLAMIREVGYCSGIENYSRHLSGKKEGEPPETLLSYFKKDFLTIIDESHVTLPQLQGMYAGDASRKKTLVEYGFRLPSAKDNRPLQYPEFEERIGQVIYTSATPSEQERTQSAQIVEQIIRPTGLVDPETIVRPVAEKGAYKGQIQDFIKETEATIKRGFRVLATTLTKKMAEDLSVYLKDKKIKAEYLHSDIKTLDRIRILTEFRKGKHDVLVGVNLLREGLDLPEVALIGILDADKEGFLRSETSLIQTIGRAARNSEGRVILYADQMTKSMESALGETKRRRDTQLSYNKKHGITPKTILKNIKDITEAMESEHGKAVNAELNIDLEVFKKAYAKELKLDRSKITQKKTKEGNVTEVKLHMSDGERSNLVYEKIIKIKEKEMSKAVKELDFETAAILRDEMGVLRERIDKSVEA
ncbi:MAG: excinuclease ABC subunit UvrB [Candidatus Pacebacteria bacterium]|nr:excinuclease ABC subunit UvrB [Candidatus Paceibacterota bacterium]MBP9851133.1 excinuclease ABC subunit UvrB [Candidatus Paceibacterota bacterium]